MNAYNLAEDCLFLSIITTTTTTTIMYVSKVAPVHCTHVSIDCQLILKTKLRERDERERERERASTRANKKGKKAIFHTTNYNVCQSGIECLNTHTHKHT